MYKCETCGELFEETGIKEEKWKGEFWGAPFTQSDWYECCPNCGETDDYEELKECPVCRQDYITSDKDQCEYCDTKISQWMQNSIENIANDTGAESDDIIKAMVRWIENL